MLRHRSQFVPNTSTDIRGHEALLHHNFTKRYRQIQHYLALTPGDLIISTLYERYTTQADQPTGIARLLMAQTPVVNTKVLEAGFSKRDRKKGGSKKKKKKRRQERGKEREG